MRSIFVFILASFTLQQALASVVLSDADRQLAFEALYNATENAFGGDMVLTSGQKASLKTRVANPNFAVRWPNGIVPYYIDPSLNSITGLIQQAAAHISSATGGCIKFVPRSNQAKYVRMFYGTGCNSLVGMWGAGAQDLSLGQGCHFVGTIIHEMLHAVGFDHEQNRPDRDNYLNIYWQNIQPQFYGAFNKVDKGITYNAFDFESIMLYGDNAFAINPATATMLDKTGKHKLYHPYDRTAMTASDVFEVKRYYGCQ